MFNYKQVVTNLIGTLLVIWGNYYMYHRWDNYSAVIKFKYMNSWKGWIRHYSQTSGSRLNFTGQHRTFIKDIRF